MELHVKVLELPPLIAREQVEAYFPGILKRSTLARLASEGRGPQYLKVGRKVVYRAEELLRWLQEQGFEVKTLE